MLRLALLLLLPASILAQGPFPQPKTFPPDDATLKKIKDKTEELRQAVAAIPLKQADSVPQVAVFLKAAEWIVRHGEWLTEKSAQQTLEVLDAGLKRATALKDGKTPWLEVKGKPLALGYKSSVDGSVQPYSLLFPADYDPTKKYRLDVVLHGRDGTLTEVKFLHAKEFAKAGKAPDHFVMEVYGRGNNAYRWAGETDVFEAMSSARFLVARMAKVSVTASALDDRRVFLRGFSMGGAGTWHIGLHNPSHFAAISPGAGFTTTRGYVGNLPKELPDYVEKCLHIYDAVDYAENVFNVPVIAYSGEKDPQKAAADNIEKALKDFKEPHTFKHLIAPGLEHRQPAEWLKKIDDEYRLVEPKKAAVPERVRFVTYTLNYPHAEWFTVRALDAHYQRSVIDTTWNEKGLSAVTTNVRGFSVGGIFTDRAVPKEATIDGQTVAIPPRTGRLAGLAEFEKVDGKWRVAEFRPSWPPRKEPGLTGPIDAAFKSDFTVLAPTGKPWHEATAAFTDARLDQFDALWDKYFRGPRSKRVKSPEDIFPNGHWVMFGDPQSNPDLAKVLPKLPIKWTKDELVVNGVKYDPKTHVPVLIYPHPTKPLTYIVINSGHTFGEADLRGTNALLYPRLGDWAVLKPTPTKQNPAAFEVVAAGLFDENWQFQKK